MVRRTMLDSRRNISLGCAVSALAGYVDAIGFVHLGGLFVSFMSGNSTRMGVSLAEGQWLHAAKALGLIALFVIGAAAGSLIVLGRGANRQPWVLLAEALLLAAAALCYTIGLSNAAVAAIVLAMGLESAGFPIQARAACLIGWPAAHSRSPLIHHYWLRTLGIEGGYNIEAVPPEGFAEFVMHLSTHGFVGANVTIPHKERALALSMPDARARAVGAANTLWYEGGELRSTNTDIEGFINNLDACAPGWDAATDALVLGAGGSSRAVVFGLIERGIKRVHLANRTIERARALADRFGANVHPVSWDAMSDLLPRAGLLVNTTSLGMDGQPALEVDAGLLPSHAVVADLVYVPLETPLLPAPRPPGLKTAHVLGILLHQAVRGVDLWFGQRPEVTPELRALVEADLTKV